MQPANNSPLVKFATVAPSGLNELRGSLYTTGSGRAGDLHPWLTTFAPAGAHLGVN